MLKKLVLIAFVVISINVFSQKKYYSSGNVYVELVDINTSDVSGTLLFGRIDTILLHENNNIDIEINTEDGDKNFMFLKDIPDMASKEFRYMKDVNARNKDEFFVANLISSNGILVLLKSSGRNGEMLRMRITNIR